MAAARPNARLFAVLGDMLELGPNAADEHAAIGRYAGEVGAHLVLAVGEHADDLVSGAVAGGGEARRVHAKGEVAGQLADLQPGDVVLVKASRGVGLETVAEDLLGAPC
jgi:UDP-N-acetylmuramoyl-tripeptide--D-alanyl-D-alanine ligase